MNKTYFIIPYGIYGGGEIYLENHINQGTFKNPHFIFLSQQNELFSKIKNRYPYTIIRNITELGNFILANKEVQNICFYNSANVFRLLIRAKKIKPTIHITEIVHSYHSWADSMHHLTRSGIDQTYCVSAEIAKQWQITTYQVLPPIIDVAKFKNAKRTRGEDGKIIVGVVARLSHEKNLKRVCDIAKLMGPEFSFVIVGKDGGCKQELAVYAQSIGVGNKVIIKQHSNQIENEYANFDLFLLTSNIEGTPLTILEAQACGLPVVAPNVGAIKEMMNEKIGYVFEPQEDNQKIAYRIQRLVEYKIGDINDSNNYSNCNNNATSSTTSVAINISEKVEEKKVVKQTELVKKPNDFEKGLVSIIISTYKGLEYIKDYSLRSILNQTYQNFEIIILNDGQDSQLCEYIESINDSRIKYFESKRPHYKEEEVWAVGGAHNINKGLDLVKGEFICHLDQDDIWKNTFLETRIKFFNSNLNVDFVYGKTIFLENNTTKMYYGCPIKKELFLNGTNYIPHLTIMYRSKLKSFKMVESGVFPADYKLWLDIYNAGNNLYFLDELDTIYNRKNGNTKEGMELFYFNTFGRVFDPISNFKIKAKKWI